MSTIWFLIGFGVLLLGVLGWSVRRRSNWQTVAKKTGLTFKPYFILSNLPGKISGRYQNYEVVLESLNKGTARHSYSQTRVTVVVKKRSAIYLYVRGQGAAFPKVPESDKTKGICDQSFSPDFFVICHPAGFAIDLLSVEVQDRLKQDLDSGVVTYNDDELSLTWPGIDHRATELVQHLELAIYLAAQIKQLRGYF